MRYYRNYLIGVLIFAPILGLVAKLIARAMGADVRYIVAVGSTFVGYCLAILFGIVSGLVMEGSLPLQVRLLAGVCGMVLAHAILLRSRDKQRLGLLKAAAV